MSKKQKKFEKQARNLWGDVYLTIIADGREDAAGVADAAVDRFRQKMGTPTATIVTRVAPLGKKARG